MSRKPEKIDELLGRVQRTTRQIVTPDGVPLRIDLADAGERFAAFGGDFLVTLMGSILIGLAGILVAGLAPQRLTIAASVFVFFVVRNGYFIFFEIRWAGATPGKRIAGLRVIDRHGGPLTTGAIVARNLTREVEFYFPAMMLLSSQGWARAPWETVAILGWLVLMWVFPLCNRDRMRVGDLIGGTIVIAVPKQVLLEELVKESQALHFSEEHLQHYGILELQVLEEILRRPHGSDTDRLLGEVSAKIARRIGWGQQVRGGDVERFLSDFYAAQRAYLERRKNLGEERADKHYRSQQRA